MNLVNADNGHTSFFTDTRNASKCNILRGGKKSRKKRCKKRCKKHRGGYNFKGGARGYGFTAESAALMNGPGSYSHATTPTSMYKNCGLIPATGMGAGKLGGYVGIADIQSGAGKDLFAESGVISSKQHIPLGSYNQYPNATTGYTDGSLNANFAGSYPSQTKSYTSECPNRQGGGSRIYNFIKGARNPFRVVRDMVNYVPLFAQQGGTRRRKRKGRSRKHSRKRRAGKHSRKRKRRAGKRRSRKQRGGYAQYNSNIPLTSSLETAVGPARGSWEGQLAAPPTYNRTNNCNNNYNHFLGTNTRSPILDQGVQ